MCFDFDFSSTFELALLVRLLLLAFFPRPSRNIPMDPPSSTQGDRERPKHVKYASIDPVYPKAALTKTHARRRTERDLPCGHAHPKAHIIQALLTPPLTPASSIRTSGSSRDSAAERRLADSADAEKTVEGKEEKTSEQFTVLDPDEEATRVVLVGSFCFQFSHIPIPFVSLSLATWTRHSPLHPSSLRLLKPF